MNYPMQKSDLDNAVRRAPYRAYALDVLTRGGKLTGTERRGARRATYARLVVSPDKPIHPAIKLTLKLQSLPLERVIRRQKQFARRASTAKHILAKMRPESPLRSGMEAAHGNWIGKFQQATAEIHARNLAATNRLAP